ncbi:mechanosensitive ion channel family protein [Halorhabdus sp. CBA1104]|uniref:mechanosensitive ion channel domain-containing protein n=1 Tax=unclassified Halorhabdus TaxID=2621901 RepID=UPI0012B3024B|nr:MULTISPECIES: mechanosensitive ion channel domain-containing protein [unclassified Halorhabdus]QGN06798.1 mechanosensitive ion channel family protein [Halorhabdus sp. CBA1104]
MVELADIVRTLFSEETAVTVAIGVLFIGAVAGYLVWRTTRNVLTHLNVPEAVEGTAFERTIQNFGLSTVGVLSQMAALFVYVLAVFVALQVAEILDADLFWQRFPQYLPQLFIAAVVVIVGLVIGDKVSLAISERLKSVKLPEVTLLPKLAKYSIFYVAALIALGQLGVATTALVVLLAAYAFGLLFLSALAFKDLLTAAAAGTYLLLTEPYSIGDEVEIDDRRGVVQEIDVFVTHVESDEAEFIIPNQRVVRSGITRFR